MAFGLPGAPKPEPEPARPKPAARPPAPAAAPPPPPPPVPKPAPVATNPPAPPPPSPPAPPPRAPVPEPPPPRPDASSRRARRSIGVSVGVSVLSAVVIWTVIAVLTTYFQLRPWDVTHRRAFTLSTETVTLLKRINQPLKIWTLFPNRKNEPILAVLPEVEALLDEFRVETRNIEYKRIDPDRDPAASRDLIERLKLDPRKSTFGIAIEYGTRARLVTADQLAQWEQVRDKGRTSLRETSFLGEIAITNALLNLLEDSTPKIDLTAGHGELDPEDLSGKGFFYARNEIIYDKFEVRSRFLLEKGDIPADTTALIVAGPIEPFDPTETAKIAKFLERGGGLIMMCDPRRSTGLEPLLAHFGVEFGNDIVVDPAQKAVSTSPTTIYAEAKVKHAVVSALEGARFRMATNRSVRKLPTSPNFPPGLERTELIHSSASSWADINLSAANWKKELDKGDTAGPIPLAMAVRVPPDPTRPESAARGGIRMVLFGSRESFANECIQRSLGNSDLLRSSVNWVSSRDRVAGTRPIAPDFRPLQLTEDEARRAAIIAYTVPPGLFIIIGLLIAWRRRR